MTRPAAPDGYMHADAAAELLGVSLATVSRLARRDRWRRVRQPRTGNSGSGPWVYVATDVRTTARERRA